MSYSFGMFFKEIEEKDILSLFSKACEIMIKNSQEHLEKQVYYIPSLRSNKMNEYVDKYWLDTAFSLHFVYWKSKKLLGLSGYNYPKEFEDLFDCHVTFQNSCDSDYDYDVWNDKISFFKEMKEQYKNISADEILKNYQLKGEDWYTKEDIQEDLKYYQKSLLYDLIFDELYLNDWLYGYNNPNFTRFCINPIDCIEKKFDIEKQLADLKNKVNTHI